MASQRKQGVVLSYIFMALEIFSSIFFTPFLIRSFGQAEYGIYSLVNSIAAYLYLFDMGVGNSIVKYSVNDNAIKQGNVMFVSLLFYALMGLLMFIVGLVLKANFTVIFEVGLSDEQIEKAKIMFFITLINMAITLVSSPLNKTILGYEKFTFSKTADIIKICLRVLISIVVLKFGGRAIAILTINLLMTVLFSLLAVVYNIKYIKVKPIAKQVDLSFIKEVFSFSFIVFVQMIATQLNAMVDQVLMGIMLTSSAVIIGIYAIGAQFGTYLQSFASSVNGLLMPGVVKMVEQKESPVYIEKEMIRIGRVVFMLLSLIYCIFVVFGNDFVKLWAGEENSQAYYVGVIIMFPLVFSLSQAMGGQILWAMNRHKVQALLQIIVALSNIFLTAIMIQWNPLLGASIATAITYLVGNVGVQNIVFTKYIGISMPRFYKGLFKGILPCIFGCVLAGVAVKLLKIDGWAGLTIHCSIMAGTYMCLMFWKGMNSYEKNLVLSMLGKVKINIQRSK